MKKAIGKILNPDGLDEPMTVYYNGEGEPMTAECGHLVEDIGYTPSSEEDAREAAMAMYGAWPWEYEEI